MKKENKENEKSLKKVKEEKGKTKFTTRIKKRWLISGTNTILLIAILIAIFILINSAISYWDPTPIDCTASKDYTLTEESKERVANIDKDVNIYFVGWSDTDKDYLLAKQYNKANSKIKVEIVDATKDLEIAKKYDVTNDSMAIIIECGEISRTLLYYSDILTYDSTGKTVDLAEQKITSAILNVTSGEVPKAYFLTGYTSFSFENNGGLYGLSQYLDDEVLTYENLNILNTQKVPDDCDTLIIMTPEKDFDTITKDAIIDYIKKGGNILWLNGAYVKDLKLTNVNKVLGEYGIKGFETGYVFETDSNKIIMSHPACFAPEVQNTDITEDVYRGLGAIFLYPTKININTDKLEDLKVVKTDLVLSSETSYFTKDITSTPTKSNAEKGTFTLGAKMVKTISEANEDEEKEEVTSKLVIYGNDAFTTDQVLQDGQGNSYYMIYFANNADVMLNSIAYLTNRDQDITIRKSYSDSITSFNPTDGEKATIMRIIFIVPIVIIILGIIVWVIRKRKQ